MIKDKCRAWFYLSPCYYYPKDNRLEGRGVISQFFLDVFIFIHQTTSFITTIFIDYEPMFPIRVHKDDYNNM